MDQKKSFFDKIGLDRLSDRVGGFLDEVFLPEEIAQTLREATLAMEREAYREALEKLFRAHREQPSFQRTHDLIGQCYFHLGEYDKALGAFEEAIAGREDASSHLWAGLAAEKLARQAPRSRYFHQAQVHFKRGLGASGASGLEFELYFGLGRVYLGQGRADKAVRELKKAVKRRPEHVEAHIALARALLGRGRLEEAREILGQPALEEAGAHAALLRGEVEEAAGRAQAARIAYELALETSGALTWPPGSHEHTTPISAIENKTNIDKTTEENQEIEQNRADFEKNGEKDQKSDDSAEIYGEFNLIRALIGAARTSLKLGDAARANAYLLRTLEQATGAQLAEVNALLGRANESVGNDARAVDYYQAALAIAQASALVKVQAHLGIGWLLLRMPQDVELQDSELQGSDLQDAQSKAYQTAQEHFQAVLNGARHHVDPARRAAQLGLARVFLGLGELSEARRLVDEVLQDASEPMPAALHLLGEVALNSGDAAEAAVAFEEARGALEALKTLSRERMSTESSARGKNPRNSTISGVPGDMYRVKVGAAQIEAGLGRALNAMRFRWQLPEEIDSPGSLLEVLHQVQDFVGGDARLAAFVPRTQRLVAELDAPLSIALVGEFNAGKSTLLNAIIGEEVAPMGVLPTTAHTCFVRYGPRKAARVVYRDGRAQELSLSEAKALMKTNTDDIDHLQVMYPHPDLRLVEFWDTPGFNALEESHEETANRALEQAEGILWVLDANQALSQTEFNQIERVSAGDERLVILLNKIDRLGAPGERDAQVETLLDYVREHTARRSAGCFALAGKDALSWRLLWQGNDGDRRAEDRGDKIGAETGDKINENEQPEIADERAHHLEESGFTAFREFLDSALIERSGRIKTLESSRKTAILLQDLSQFQEKLLQNYRQLGATGEEVSGWLDQAQAQHPQNRAREEARKLEDRFDFMLSALEREIEEALRAQTTFLSRASLTRPSLLDEDRAFVLEVLGERIEDILGRSHQEILADVEEIESQLAQRVGAVLAGLPVGDRRAMTRRLEGFFGETRVLKLLLGERVYGHLRAMSAGQIRAGGHSALDSVRMGQSGRLAPGARSAKSTGARAALRELLPDVRAHLDRELIGWYKEFFLAARRFLDRVQRDLHLLQLEAGHRFDVSAPREFLGA